MSVLSRLGASLLSAALAMFSVVCHAGTNSWTVKGPLGGDARSVQAHPTAPQVFYAVFERSLHRSIDGGATWTLLRHFNDSATGLAIDPADGDRIYVAVLNEGLYRSENRGDSFTLIMSDPFVPPISAVGTNATAVYFATIDGRIHRSLDRGISWTARGQMAYQVMKILVDPHDADVLFALEGSEAVISSDGGATWMRGQTAAHTGFNDIAQLSATQLVATTSDAIHFSSDRGATWTHSFQGRFSSLAADRMTPGRAVAAPERGGLIAETTDYGATWQLTGQWSDGRHAGIAIDSRSSSYHVLLGPLFARYSTSLDQPWIDALQAPIAQRVLQFDTTSTSNAKVYAFLNGSGGSGLFTTLNDNGWQQLPLPLSGQDSGRLPFAVRPDDPNRLYTGVHRRLYRSTDGGQSWYWASAGMDGRDIYAFSFDPEQEDTLYASVRKGLGPADFNSIYRSTDDGTTWTPWSTNLPSNVFGTRLQFDPANPSRMFLSASQLNVPRGGGLYRSNDRGITWEQLFAGHTAEMVAFDSINPSRVYAVVGGALQVSDDGGQTFSTNSSINAVTADPDQYVGSLAIDPEVPSTLYATTYSVPRRPSSYVLRSVDSGQTWEALRSGTDPAPWQAWRIMLDPNTPSLAYVAVSSQGVASFEVAPDLSLEILGHTVLHARGHESTFTLRAINNGPFAATRVNLSATLPTDVTHVSYSTDRGSCSADGCVAPTLQVGEEMNATLRYMTPATALSVAVSGTVSAHENDAEPGNNTAQATALTGDPGDLSVTVAPSATSITQGGTVTYTVTVTNRGDAVSSEGTLTFTLGSGFTLGALPDECSAGTGTSDASCGLGTIAVGDSQALTFNAVATTARVVTASANVATHVDIADTDTTNNTATSSVTATAPPLPNGGNNTGGGGDSNSGGGKGGGGAMNLAALIGCLLLAGRRRFAVTR